MTAAKAACAVARRAALARGSAAAGRRTVAAPWGLVGQTTLRALSTTIPADGIARNPMQAAQIARQLSDSPQHSKSETPMSVTFVGGGKMAEAIIGGLVKNPASFKVTGAVDINRKRREHLDREYGIKTFESVQDAKECLQNTDLLVVAIKPQVATKVFAEVRSVLPAPEDRERDLTAISILAGIPIKKLRDGLGIDSICRSMPNTPAQAQAGMTVWTTSGPITQERRRALANLFEVIGEEEYVSDEDLLDASTALSGSGPAYFLMTMEALIDSGVHMGLSRDLATRLVQQTMYGTAIHVAESDKHPAVLRNDITSPGGTTSYALYMAERGGLRTTLSDSIWAAYRRSRELGEKDSEIGPVLNR